MKTLIIRIPDNKYDYVYNLLTELPYTQIYKKEQKTKKINNWPNPSSLEELLKEGYIASQSEDKEIMNDFSYADFEQWD